MLACSGIGILIGWVTAEKIVVTQDGPSTAAELVEPSVSSASIKEAGPARGEPENRPSRDSHPQEEASDTVTPPTELLVPGTSKRISGRG